MYICVSKGVLIISVEKCKCVYENLHRLRVYRSVGV